MVAFFGWFSGGGKDEIASAITTSLAGLQTAIDRYADDRLEPVVVLVQPGRGEPRQNLGALS